MDTDLHLLCLAAVGGKAAGCRHGGGLYRILGVNPLAGAELAAVREPLAVISALGLFDVLGIGMTQQWYAWNP